MPRRSTLEGIKRDGVRAAMRRKGFAHRLESGHGDSLRKPGTPLCHAQIY
jgi:hypothetical protein